jgi:hypothetical protein
MRDMTENEKALWSVKSVEPTIEEKLANAGLSLEELKAALGL